MLGAVFALGWAPCTGPTLAAVLVLASDHAWTRRSGAAWSSPMAYGLGLGLPFVLIAAGLDRAGRALGVAAPPPARRSRSSAGVMLVLVGLLMVTGVWEDLNRWLQTELVNGFEVSV